MCDIRLFRSAKADYDTAVMIWKNPYDDEMILNNAAYHLQQKKDYWNACPKIKETAVILN